jgi:hypothetical protein
MCCGCVEIVLHYLSLSVVVLLSILGGGVSSDYISLFSV